MAAGHDDLGGGGFSLGGSPSAGGTYGGSPYSSPGGFDTTTGGYASAGGGTSATRSDPVSSGSSPGSYSPSTGSSVSSPSSSGGGYSSQGDSFGAGGVGQTDNGNGSSNYGTYTDGGWKAPSSTPTPTKVNDVDLGGIKVPNDFSYTLGTTVSQPSLVTASAHLTDKTPAFDLESVATQMASNASIGNAMSPYSGDLLAPGGTMVPASLASNPFGASTDGSASPTELPDFVTDVMPGYATSATIESLDRLVIGPMANALTGGGLAKDGVMTIVNATVSNTIQEPIVAAADWAYGLVGLEKGPSGNYGWPASTPPTPVTTVAFEPDIALAGVEVPDSYEYKLTPDPQGTSLGSTVNAPAATFELPVQAQQEGVYGPQPASLANRGFDQPDGGAHEVIHYENPFKLEYTHTEFSDDLLVDLPLAGVATALTPPIMAGGTVLAAGNPIGGFAAVVAMYSTVGNILKEPAEAYRDHLFGLAGLPENQADRVGKTVTLVEVDPNISVNPEDLFGGSGIVGSANAGEMNPETAQKLLDLYNGQDPDFEGSTQPGFDGQGPMPRPTTPDIVVASPGDVMYYNSAEEAAAAAAASGQKPADPPAFDVNPTPPQELADLFKGGNDQPAGADTPVFVADWPEPRPTEPNITVADKPSIDIGGNDGFDITPTKPVGGGPIDLADFDVPGGSGWQLPPPNDGVHGNPGEPNVNDGWVPWWLLEERQHASRFELADVTSAERSVLPDTPTSHLDSFFG